MFPSPDQVSLPSIADRTQQAAIALGGVIRNYGKGTLIIKKPGKPTIIIKNWRRIVCNNTILNILQLHAQPRIEAKSRTVQTEFQLGFTSGIPVSNAVIMREELQQISKKILYLSMNSVKKKKKNLAIIS